MFGSVSWFVAGLLTCCRTVFVSLLLLDDVGVCCYVLYSMLLEKFCLGYFSILILVCVVDVAILRNFACLVALSAF